MMKRKTDKAPRSVDTARPQDRQGKTSDNKAAAVPVDAVAAEIARLADKLHANA